MNEQQPNGEFAGYAGENRRIWNANAEWWDDRIGEGNAHQTELIEPSTERLLAVEAGDRILDAACGAGRFARRMAELGASVVAFDHSEKFVERAKSRTPEDASIQYHVADAAETDRLLELGAGRFDKAVCTMALMDMPEIAPLLSALRRLLKPKGVFVFSVAHPCFHSASIQRFCEIYEEPAGRSVTRTGVKVSSYLSPAARKTEGILGQPEPQYYYHRPISALFRAGFEVGFVVTGVEEPAFAKPEKQRAGVRWHDMPDIPPVLVVRMVRMELNEGA